ncbi:unnamed protein product [Triticum turgidum subsp. durum]|uniref:Uncharacterized protein n=1 Tax=Triticum turgidum subsp. durum TaxID=4567 RepID=A0A9R1NVS7_TRITD|nr:unnamed protein product [Triticum turgidum subsp. durum]
MALRSPELRFAASTGLGALSRPSRLAPSPLAALASPRRRRRGPSPSPSPSPSDSNPSTASAGDADGPEWKKVSAKRFGYKESMIPDEAWNVLHQLRSRGASLFRVLVFYRGNTELSLLILSFFLS